MKRSLKSRKALFKNEQPVLVRPGLLDAPTGNGLTKGDELLRRLKFEFDYDPLSELISIARADDTTNQEKIRIAQEILGYYQPKVKAISLNPNAGETISLNIMFPDKDQEHGLEDLAINNTVDVDADKLQSPSDIHAGA